MGTNSNLGLTLSNNVVSVRDTLTASNLTVTGRLTAGALSPIGSIVLCAWSNPLANHIYCNAQSILSNAYPSLYTAYSNAGVPTAASTTIQAGSNIQTNGGTAIELNHYQTYGAAYAFDGLWTTPWLSADVNPFPPSWVGIQWSTGKPVNTYRFYQELTGKEPRKINDWHFDGSDNGTTWIVLDTRSGGAAGCPSSGYSPLYQFANNYPYKYYRLYATSLNDNSWQHCEIIDLNLQYILSAGEYIAPYGQIGVNYQHMRHQ
jgi:hypothetical protein